MFRSRLVRAVAAASLLTAVAACSPDDGTTSPQPSVSASVDACAKSQLHLVASGQLTIGTARPTTAPWFVADNPPNGQGFESAVAYMVADRLGFARNEVVWMTVPAADLGAAGRKKFDFDIGQLVIAPEHERSNDFSAPYYRVSQVVITLPDSPIANAKRTADLRGARLGGVAGSVALTTLTTVVQPATAPTEYPDTDAAATALTTRQVDGLAVDAATAYRLVVTQVPAAKVLGRLPTAGTADEYRLLFEKGNPLLGCVNQVLAKLKSGNELSRLQKQWLAPAGDVPELAQ